MTQFKIGDKVKWYKFGTLNHGVIIRKGRLMTDMFGNYLESAVVKTKYGNEITVELKNLTKELRWR